MATWDTPPTADEIKGASGGGTWSTPPTPEEMRGGHSPRAPRVAAAESAARGGLQGLSLGWGDEGSAAIAALLPFLDREAAKGDTVSDRYKTARDFYRNRNASAQSDNPGSFLAGELAGGAAPALVGGAAATATRAPGLVGRAVQAAKTGAKVGAIAGAGASSGDTLTGIAGDAVGGAAGGAVLGPVVGEAAGAVGRGVRRLAGKSTQQIPGAAEVVTLEPAAPNAVRRVVDARVTPTPEAVFLEKQGVPLTAGQRNPRSAIGQIEEASTSLRFTGPAISAQRDAAQRGWQNVVLSKGLPPGMKGIPRSDAVSTQLDALYKGFEPAYGVVKGQSVYPAIHQGGKGVPLQTFGKSVGAFDQAVSDPSVLADDATRATVKRFLDNELSRLPERKGAIQQVPAEDLMAVRSHIRDAWRMAKRQGKHDAAALLDNAEGAVTDALDSQLDPGLSAALRKTDAQYRNYKIIEDAVSRAGDSPSGFSPSMLTQAIKAASDRGSFARSTGRGGGDLRDLSKAGRVVFESRSPPTGARLLTVGPLGEWVTGPITFAINRPSAASRVTPLALPERAASSRFAALLQALESRPAAGVAGAGAEDAK